MINSLITLLTVFVTLNLGVFQMPCFAQSRKISFKSDSVSLARLTNQPTARSVTSSGNRIDSTDPVSTGVVKPAASPGVAVSDPRISPAGSVAPIPGAVPGSAAYTPAQAPPPAPAPVPPLPPSNQGGGAPPGGGGGGAPAGGGGGGPQNPQQQATEKKQKEEQAKIEEERRQLEKDKEAFKKRKAAEGKEPPTPSDDPKADPNDDLKLLLQAAKENKDNASCNLKGHEVVDDKGTKSNLIPLRVELKSKKPAHGTIIMGHSKGGAVEPYEFEIKDGKMIMTAQGKKPLPFTSGWAKKIRPKPLEKAACDELKKTVQSKYKDTATANPADLATGSSPRRPLRRGTGRGG